MALLLQYGANYDQNFLTHLRYLPPYLVPCLPSEILSKTLTQQTGSGMAQLCMWQLVVGFNLREMEAREDLRKNFNK